MMRLLLVAKAPVAGHAKTRLGAVIGYDAAADLAAAALLDTLEAAAAAFPGACFLALEGDLGMASRSAELVAAVVGWQVFDQAGTTFGERLAHAHGVLADTGPGPVLQIGMDTPQVSGALLRQTAAGLTEGHDVVLGPAEDGGWWALGLADPRRAAALVQVTMSAPTTYAETVQVLSSPGTDVRVGPILRDVDTAADAALVARLAPQTRFARAWDRVGVVLS